MARRNLNYISFDNVDASTNQTSKVSNIDGVDKLSILVSWTSTPVGVLEIQVTNDENMSHFVAVNELLDRLQQPVVERFQGLKEAESLGPTENDG